MNAPFESEKPWELLAMIVSAMLIEESGARQIAA
jgi:hypothetical protein